MEKRTLQLIAVWMISAFIISSIGFVSFAIFAKENTLNNLITIEDEMYNDDIYRQRPSVSESISGTDILVYPQYRFDYTPINHFLTVGEIGNDEFNRDHHNRQQLRHINKSNDAYGILKPVETLQTETSRFFTFNFEIMDLFNLDVKGTLEELMGEDSEIILQFGEQIVGYPLHEALSTLWFFYEIEPDQTAYLSYDSITNASSPYYSINNAELMKSRFNAPNDIFIPIERTRYYEFIDSTGENEELSFELAYGSVTLRNDSLYNLYDVFTRMNDKLTDVYHDQFTIYNLLLNLIETFLLDQRGNFLTYYFETQVLLWLYLNPEFRTYFQNFILTYDDFLEYLGIDLAEGLRGYLEMNPYAIHEIEGKMEFYINMPKEDPTTPDVEAIHIQCWNYYIDDWVNVFSIEGEVTDWYLNDWYEIEFYIDSNPWQYFTTPEDRGDFINYRILVEASRNETQTGDINVRLGGMWTSLNQRYKELVYDFYFNAGGDVRKEDLLVNPIFEIEYHTRNFDTVYDQLRIVRPFYNIFDLFYSLRQLTIELDELEELMEKVLADEAEFEDVEKMMIWLFGFQGYNTIISDEATLPASPYMDRRRGFEIPSYLVYPDTMVHLRLYGRFSAFDSDGRERDDQAVYIDKASLKYNYKTPYNITSELHVDYNNLEYCYVSYDVDILPQFVHLEFPIPRYYEFISDDFGLVESPLGKVITNYWINSYERHPVTGNFYEEPLYDRRNIRLNSKITFFEGIGTYRFWFRIPNFVSDLNVTDSDQQPYAMYDDLLMGDQTNYTIYLNPHDELRKEIDHKIWQNGNMYLQFTGTDFHGGEFRDTGLIEDLSFEQQPYPYFDSDDETLMEYTRYNSYSLYYTHSHSDDFWGEITSFVVWTDQNEQYIGFRFYKFHIRRVVSEPPILSIDSPRNITEWGAHITNYAIVRSYHFSTTQVQLNFTDINETIDLISYSDYLNFPENYPNIIPPDAFMNLDQNLHHWYWFYPIHGSYFDDYYNVVGHSIPIRCQITGTSTDGVEEYTTDPVNVTFHLINQVEFDLRPLNDIYVNQRQVLRYQLPHDIKTMQINLIIGDGVERLPISIIGNETFSPFLQAGGHTYVVPFRFVDFGEYSFEIYIEDFVGNSKTIQTNRFFVIEEDPRVWYARLLDNTFEILSLWGSTNLALMGLGIFVIRKKNTEGEMSYEIKTDY